MSVQKSKWSRVVRWAEKHPEGVLTIPTLILATSMLIIIALELIKN